MELKVTSVQQSCVNKDPRGPASLDEPAPQARTSSGEEDATSTEPHPTPVREETHGVLRVAGSRVTLDALE